MDKATKEEKATLLSRLAEITQDERDARANEMLPCVACNARNRIKDTAMIQTHWYTEPSGCTDGDYWSEGEPCFICKCGTINRLLTNLYRYDDRPMKEEMTRLFNRQYRPLFKECIETHGRHHAPDKKTAGMPHVNNYWLDKRYLKTKAKMVVVVDGEGGGD